jgi:hypothetical protein
MTIHAANRISPKKRPWTGSALGAKELRLPSKGSPCRKRPARTIISGIMIKTPKSRKHFPVETADFPLDAITAIIKLIRSKLDTTR